jgi:hypothetical protein
MIVAMTVLVIAAATMRPMHGGPDSITTMCVVCGLYGGVDVVLNVILFIPLGFGLGLSRLRPLVAIAGVCGFSLLIETLQLSVVAGRDASLGDVITNTSGGVIGLLLGRYLVQLLRPSTRVATSLTAFWLLLWLGAQALFAYALTPVIPGAPLYGQVARPLGRARVAFIGRVLDWRIGAETVTPGRLPNAAEVSALLARRDAVIAVATIPAAIPKRWAEIVRISGPRQESVLGLEQDGRSVVFRMRTGADVLRLRPFAFRVANVFPGTPGGGDTVHVFARFGATEVTLGGRGPGVDRSHRFRLRTSDGWRILMPFQTVIDDAFVEILVSLLFFLVLILPAGYWAHGAIAASPRRAAAVLGTTGLVIAVGLNAIPRAFGVGVATGWEWLAIVGGLSSGALLAAFATRLVFPAVDRRLAP